MNHAALQTLEPLAEKRVYEPVFPVVVEYESVGHEPVYRPFHRRGAKDGCCREEFHGEDFLSAFGGHGRQHSHLERREATDEYFIVVPFARKDDIKSFADVCLGNGLPVPRAVPYRVAKLLYVAGRVPRDFPDGIKRYSVKLAFACRKSGREELVEVVSVDFADGERGGAPVERAVRVHEDVCHLVADAAEEDVGRLCVELDASAHDGDDSLSVLDVEDVLEFVEDHAALAFCSMSDNCVKNGFERGQVSRRLCIDGNRRRSCVRVYGKRRPQTCECLNDLFEKSGGILESCKGGREPTAEVGGVADAEQVGMEHRDAFHAANRLKHEGRLAHAPFSLHHDVLPGFHVSLEDAREFRPAAEVFAANGFPVLERIHDFSPLAVLHYAVLHYAVLHNGCIVPNRAAAGKWAHAQKEAA